MEKNQALRVNKKAFLNDTQTTAFMDEYEIPSYSHNLYVPFTYSKPNKLNFFNDNQKKKVEAEKTTNKKFAEVLSKLEISKSTNSLSTARSLEKSINSLEREQKFIIHEFPKVDSFKGCSELLLENSDNFQSSNNNTEMNNKKYHSVPETLNVKATQEKEKIEMINVPRFPAFKTPTQGSLYNVGYSPPLNQNLYSSTTHNQKFNFPKSEDSPDITQVLHFQTSHHLSENSAVDQKIKLLDEEIENLKEQIRIIKEKKDSLTASVIKESEKIERMKNIVIEKKIKETKKENSSLQVQKQNLVRKIDETKNSFVQKCIEEKRKTENKFSAEMSDLELAIVLKFGNDSNEEIKNLKKEFFSL